MERASEKTTNKIDEQLLRKRAEHNDGELSSLKEISLHQFDIEKIENLDVYCRNLEILYLQCNQISKIENLNKLKKLQYLQLSLNNITKIENLECCESLTKLDLTVNFIENPLEVESLKSNIFLRELFLIGNPCAQVPGYREFVITTLPQLKYLDARDIEKSERIFAAQEYPQIRAELIALRDKTNATAANIDDSKKSALKIADSNTDLPIKVYNKKTKDEPGFNPDTTKDDDSLDDYLEKTRMEFQTKPVPHTPEARLAAARDLAKLRQGKADHNGASFSDPLKKKKNDVFFASDGRVLQRNDGKYVFKWIDSPTTIVLSIEISKFLDTSLIDVDVHPTWLRVTIKEKVQGDIIDIRRQERESKEQEAQSAARAAEAAKFKKDTTCNQHRSSRYGRLDYRNIVENNKREQAFQSRQCKPASVSTELPFKSIGFRTIKDSPMIKSDIVDEDFVDDPDVPPLC
ncbi:hypothetical protein O5D80_005976 [Batrachochytrium dendrobatidis]|nr:hypothetical protein O5D80_005976 [Batrachochytrium dendrobatidis]